MAQKKNWGALVALFTLLVGVLLMFQLKARDRITENGPTPSDNVVSALAPYVAETDQLQAENSKLQAELSQYEQGVEAARVAAQRLQRTRLWSGVTPVEGAGLKATLYAKGYVAENMQSGLYVLYELDLLDLVNALWNSSAEAIAVNGQRITAATSILFTGSGIEINGSPKYPPYIIEAVGDSDKLSKGIDFVNRFVIPQETNASQFGITVEEEPVSELQLPAGSLPKYKYAVPAKGQ